MQICMFKQDKLSRRHLYYTYVFCLIEIGSQWINRGSLHAVFCVAGLYTGAFVVVSLTRRTWLEFNLVGRMAMKTDRSAESVSWSWSGRSTEFPSYGLFSRGCWIGTEDLAQQAQFPLCGMFNQLTRVSRPQRCSSTLFLLNKPLIFCMQKWTYYWLLTEIEQCWKARVWPVSQEQLGSCSGVLRCRANCLFQYNWYTHTSKV